jgi:hypothetical protein
MKISSHFVFYIRVEGFRFTPELPRCVRKQIEKNLEICEVFSLSSRRLEDTTFGDESD